MRILALKTKGLVLPSIHESTVGAFRSLGVDVVDLPVPRLDREFLSFSRLARDGYDAIFTLNLGRNPHFISHLKELQASIRIPWVIWFVDDPEGYRFPLACEPGWTVAFCWDREIVQELTPGCLGTGIPIFHLPLAADPEMFFPEKKNSPPCFPGGVFVGSTGLGNNFLEKAGRAVGFMEEFDSVRDFLEGNGQESPQALAWAYLREKTGRNLESLRADPFCRLWVPTVMYFLGIRKRRELVCLLIGPDGGLFGDSGWRNCAGDLYRGHVNYGSDLRRIYNQSSFVLDIRPAQARTGLTQRIFDAGACACPILAEYSPELEIIFQPEDQFISFRHAQEALEMKNRFLRHPEDAAARARKSRIRILAEHTYRHRAKRILSVLSRL